jgi:hypothetical protein
MKNYFIIFLLLLASCSKGVQEVQEQRMGGLIEDKPNNVPVLVSKGFINPPSIALRGKPVKGDKSTPTVSFISPANGASVTGTVTISFSATDNIGVVSTSLSINGLPVSSGTSFQWNTTGLPSGLYVITATATDAVGLSTSVSITVTINTIIVTPPPASTEVSLDMPPVGNQGSEGSCVAFAVGYAARSVDWYYRTGATTYSYSANVFSPEHLYNQVKFWDCYSGSAMQPALDYIMQNGIITWQSMPYVAGDCSLQPTATQIQEAANYKINGYHKIYTADKAMIKQMIAEKKAVIISIAGDNSFMQAKAGFVWKQYSGSGYINHCVVICGYDDAKNAWKIMNSWSTNWGDAGFSWIDYDFFPTRTGTYCYAIN